MESKDKIPTVAMLTNFTKLQGTMQLSQEIIRNICSWSWCSCDFGPIRFGCKLAPCVGDEQYRYMVMINCSITVCFGC